MSQFWGVGWWVVIWGGSELWRGDSRILLGHFDKILIYSWNPQLKPNRLAPLLGDLIKGGVRVPGHRNAGMSPSRPRGCVQANYQQLISNVQYTYCITHKLHYWSTNVLWQRCWLDLCTKQVVSARACTYHFLPYNSSGINLFGKRTVQTDSCKFSEQIDTLFISVGCQEWRFGGGGTLGRRPKLHVRCHF